jgi:hypothetical protein
MVAIEKESLAPVHFESLRRAHRANASRRISLMSSSSVSKLPWSMPFTLANGCLLPRVFDCRAQ